MTNEGEVTVLLLNELKLKRQELDAAKLGEHKTAERLSKWKQRAKAAEAERNELRAALEQNDIVDADATSTTYKQRALDAEAALSKYKQRALDARSAHQKTLEECRRLEEELAQAQKSRSNEVDTMVSKLSRYKQRVKDAEAAQNKAEANCQTQIAEVERDLEALKQQFHNTELITPDDAPYSEIERLTDEKISLALNSLPLVKGHPADNLKTIGNNLGGTINRLPENMKTSLNYWEQHSYTETQLLFTESLQHGYMLRPRKCVKYASEEKANKATWFPGNILHNIVEPFEAFFQKNGEWYYIGTYQAFYICEALWGTFKRWTTQDIVALVRATIVGRRASKSNPTNFDQVLKKYACGKLIAGYVGMKCVGFNHELYHQLQEATESKKRTSSDRQSGDEAVTDTSHKKRRTDEVTLFRKAGSSRSQPIRIPTPS